ncbi:MAG: CPBP family intramembrane glutamic endopeptidase, partial [Planctomycetota bacterium]
GGNGGALLYVPIVLLSSVGYAAAALWWAVELFKREDVLFREAERFSLKGWIKHLLREKEPTPTFAEATFAFVTILLLQFAMMGPMQRTLASAVQTARTVATRTALDAGQSAADAQAAAEAAGRKAAGVTAFRLVTIQQLVTVAFPVLAMGVLLTTSVKRTFRFRLPDWRLLLGAGALAICLQPLLGTATSWLTGRFFPELPDGFAQFSQSMAEVPLPLAFLAVAIAPAVCEELAFRGFLLSGFARARRPWLAIGLSSVAFGVVHLVPQQVFTASLAGLILGTIAWKGRSLWPCILFHLIFNGHQVLIGRAEAGDLGPVGDAWHQLLFNETGYRPVTLALCSAGLAASLIWLVRYRFDERQNSEGLMKRTARTENGLPRTASLGA